MKGYVGWKPTRWVGAPLVALLLVGFTAATASAQTNLALGSKPFSSSDWDASTGLTTFTAPKAFDGNISTRWNSDRDDSNGSFLGTRWDAPQTISKIVIKEAFGRVQSYRVQQFDATKSDWVDALVAQGDLFTQLRGGDAANPTFSMRFKPALKTNGIRIVFDEVTAVPSIFEVEAYDAPAGILQGTVRDETGNGVSGAFVRAGSEQAITDANGKYTLTVDVGTYNIEAEKPGAFRRKLARGVAIAADAAVALDFALTALPPNLARTGTASSSSDWEDGTDYNAAKANDGNLTTRWNARSDDEDGAWLEVAWSSPQTFTKVVVRQAFDRIRNYTLQRWDASKSDWADMVTNVTVPKKGGNPVLSNVFAQPITATRVRMLVVEAEAVASVYEIEASNPATATIKGTVKDAVSGQAVSRAQVTSDLGDITASDDKGNFTIIVEPDEYVLSSSAEGYFQGGGVTVAIKAGETREITLTLPPPGPNLAKEAKPIASSEDAGQPAKNINDGDIESFWQVASDKHGNEWVGVQWDKPTTFTVVQIRGVITTVQNSYLQVLAEDGKTWVDVPGTSFNVEFKGRNQDFFFPNGITTTAVRWFAQQVWAAEDNPGLGELIVYNSPLPK